MISKVVFGEPVRTDAITAEVETAKEAARFEVTEDEKSVTFRYALRSRDVVYGLGETMGKVNKRGGRYISFNTDTADHTDANPSLYASHNFIVVDGEETFGAFFDTPARVVFEIDWHDSGEIRVVCETRDLSLYQIEGGSAYEVCRELIRAVGRCYLPPLWAFGYGQSRFGYETEKDFRAVADGYQENGIPLDYICMDIDYMDGYRDFSFNEKSFPDIAAFVSEMKGRGVWPGMTHFPDFLNSRARAWFGGLYKFYTDAGFEGFWNDMNEPAMFYNEYSRGFKNVLFRLALDLLFGNRERRRSGSC